jgi:hypothetical protein
MSGGSLLAEVDMFSGSFTVQHPTIIIVNVKIITTNNMVFFIIYPPLHLLYPYILITKKQ